MGNGHNHNLHNQNVYVDRRSTYLPVLCSRPSVKDVTVSIPKCEDRSASIYGDPVSPKIGCMGQVKRNNKIAGFSSTHSLTTAKNNAVKYFSLKRFFSSKSFTSASSATTSAACSCKTTATKNGETGPDSLASINIADLDPPLPVIKRLPKMGDKGEVGTLWQRRVGGAALKSLKIQPNRHNLA